jgi:hypothetical protein
MTVCFSDLKALARAAVSGDENALDMFTWRRGKDGMKGPSLLPSEAQSFFIGLENGKQCSIFLVWLPGTS